MNLKELLSSKDLKATLQQSAKTAAGSALTKVLQKDQVQNLITQQAEQQAISTAGEQAMSFWIKYKKEIMIGGAIGGVGLLYVFWRAFRK